ncbi:sorting nexin-29-like [Mizuhopecten yessoensis]|uniref:Sorting nexin-29 n=1 Tax=Mizuhopecten yessoensis TaxID=6573 RepID=A0A210QVF1_MIZYE|nr:sorting nexin-29-like [Mizuhopecten yessoensis]OWF52733.1 Sorting nexin-29 [Mizuhopecten yessoensis]
MNGDDPHVNERQSILTRLLDAVKQCQVRFGGRTELAADADSRVSCLCAAWETGLQHGMRQSNKAILALKQVTEITGLNKVTDMFNDITNKESEAVFWQYVKEHLTKHELERFLKLQSINTDSGRGRAWLRASLNEHSLERYTHMLLESEELLSQFYESWSFLRDQERSSMMPMMAAGLGSILFAINIDNADLNTVRKPTTNVITVPNAVAKSSPTADDEPRPVIAGEESPSASSDVLKKKDKKKKKKMANIVSFDEDDSGTYSAASHLSEVDQSDYGATVGRRSFDTNIDSELSKQTLPYFKASANSTSSQMSSLYSREPSVTSGTSNDRQNSHSSFSSTDFELSDPGNLIPLTSAGTPFDLSSSPVVLEHNLSSSVDSSDGQKYGGQDVASAARALDLAQQGTAHSYRTQGDGGNVDVVAKKDAMSTDELKQAVVSMMMRKDEVEEQNRNLQDTLQLEMETSSTLRADIEDMKITSQAKQEKEAAKYQALQKENELLKHQLRRYVNAVQMLRAEGSHIDDNLGIHLDDPQPNIPPAKPSIDYSHEASEYEKKLIQVAEMHGELMEFNEMLHRQLNNKDAMLRRVQRELVDLRGPLPHDLQLADETLSMDMDSLSLHLNTLVNIWIPSAFLQGASSDQHHVYQIYLRIQDEEWNTYKRFSQFHQFHIKLKKQYPAISRYEFPPKKTIGKKETKVVENRRKVFQTYLRKVINHLLEKEPTLAANINKERLAQTLPFFSDKPPEKDVKKKGMKKSQSSASIQAASTGQSQAASAQPEYTGL